MSFYDLGAVAVLTVNVTDINGNPANCTAVTCTITQPDQTITDGTVTNPTTGEYQCQFTPTQEGRHTVAWVATGTNACAFTDSFDVREYRSILSLTDAKTFLHIDLASTDDDAELRDFMEAATAAVEARVGPVAPRTVTSEFHPGGGSVVMCRKHPVISITTVTEVLGAQKWTLAPVADPSAGSIYTYVAELPSGMITRRLPGGVDGVFPDGRQAVQLTYVAGRAIVPADIYQATLIVLEHMWQTQRGTVRGRAPAAAPSTFSLPYRATELLAPHTRAGIA